MACLLGFDVLDVGPVELDRERALVTRTGGGNGVLSTVPLAVGNKLA
jgi:hypothetical protein